MLLIIKCVKQMLVDHSVPDMLGKEFFFHAELHELLIASIYNNNTEMKKICLALLLL